MSAPKWRKIAQFAPGPRCPLNRDQRGIMRQRFRAARLGRHITALHEQIGLEGLRILGSDGRLDPAHATLASRVACCERTVSTAFRRFRNLGLMDWVQRLVRLGQQVRQTSNAYFFRLTGPIPERIRCDRKPCREAHLSKNPPLTPQQQLAALADLMPPGGWTKPAPRAPIRW
jgi:hypothetical protein